MDIRCSAMGDVRNSASLTMQHRQQGSVIVSLRDSSSTRAWLVGLRYATGSRARSRWSALTSCRFALTSSWTSPRLGLVRVTHAAGSRTELPWSVRDARLADVQTAMAMAWTSPVPRPRPIGMPPPSCVAPITAGVGCAHEGRWRWHRRPVHAAERPSSPALLRVGWRAWSAMDIVGRRCGHCRTPLWTLPDVAVDNARRAQSRLE